MIQYVTVIHSDTGNAKVDKPRENDTKTKRSRDWTWKNGIKSHFGYKLHSIIDRNIWADQKIQNNDCVTSWFVCRFIRKKLSGLQGQRSFGAKSKGYNTTMKRAVKEHLLGMSDLFRRVSAQKELK